METQWDRRPVQASQAWTQVSPAFGFLMIIWFVAVTSKILINYIKSVKYSGVYIALIRDQTGRVWPGDSFTTIGHGITIASQRKRRIPLLSLTISPD